MNEITLNTLLGYSIQDYYIILILDTYYTIKAIPFIVGGLSEFACITLV